jgi:hypothetical protein
METEDFLLFRNSRPLLPILSQINQVHDLPTDLF